MIDRSLCPATYHGTAVAYWRGCRCADGREERRLYDKRRREGRAERRLYPLWPLIRRMQALKAIGHTNEAIARESGITANEIRNLSHARHGKHVYRASWFGILKAYEALCMTPGNSVREMNRAKTRGWPPPLAWDDIDNIAEVPVVVEDRESVDEVLVGRFLTDWATLAELNTAEQVAAAHRLTKAGWSQNQISQKLHWGAERTRREMAA